jgi:hypothetical protein
MYVAVMPSLPRLLPTIGGHSTPLPDRVQCFWDFYALFMLWYKLEPAAEPRQPKNRLARAKIETLRQAFWLAAVDQAAWFISNGMRLITAELDHIWDENLIAPRLVYNWGEDNPRVMRMLVRLAPVDSLLGTGRTPTERKFELLTLPDAERIFNAPFWRNDKSDMFGGRPWANITQIISQIFESAKLRDIDSLARAVDQAYDHEHNTGLFISKFEGEKPGIEDLEQRAGIASFGQFVPLVSPTVFSLLGRFSDTECSLTETRLLCEDRINSREDVPENFRDLVFKTV